MDKLHHFTKETPSIKFEYGHIVKIKQLKENNNTAFFLRPELHIKVDDKIKPISWSLSNLYKDSPNANIIDLRGGNIDSYVNDGLEISIVDFNKEEKDFNISMVYEVTEL